MTTKRKRSLGTPARSLMDISALDETTSPRSKRIRKSKFTSDDYVVYGTTSSNSSATYFRSKLTEENDDLSDLSSQDGSQPETIEGIGTEVATDQIFMSEVERVLSGPEVIVVLDRLTEELIEQWCNPVKEEAPVKRGRGRPPKGTPKSTPKSTPKPQAPVIRTKQKLIRIIKDGRTKVIQPLDKRERLAVMAKPPDSVKKIPANIEPPRRKPCKPRLKAGAKFRAAAPSPKPSAGPSSQKEGEIVVKKDEKMEDKSTKKKDEKGGKKDKEDAPPLLKVSGNDKDKDEEYVLCMNEDGQLLYVPTNVAMNSSTGSVRAQVTLPTDEEKSDEKGEKKDEASPAKKAPAKQEVKKSASTKKKEDPVTDMIEPSDDGPFTSVSDLKTKSCLPKSTTKKATKKLVPEGKGGKNAKGQDFVLCYNKVEDEYVYISRDLIKPKKDEAFKKDDALPKGKAKTAASAKKPVLEKVDKPKAKVIDVAKKFINKKPEPLKKTAARSEAPKSRLSKPDSTDDIFNARPMKPVVLPVKKVTSQYLKPPVVEKKPLVFTQHYITPRDVSRSAQGTVLLDPTTDEVITVNNKPEASPSPLTDATAALLKIGRGLQHDLAGKAEEPATEDNDWINVFINGSRSSEAQPPPSEVSLQQEPVVSTPVTSTPAETVLQSQEVIYEGSGLTDGQILTTVDGQYVVASADQTIVEQPQEQLIMTQDSQVVVTTTASDPVSSAVYTQPQQNLEAKEETAAPEVVYEQQTEIMQEAVGDVVYEQPQDQVVYEEDPAQEVVYEQDEQTQEVVYEQAPQEEQPVQQQDVVCEQPQEEQQQQEVVFEQSVQEEETQGDVVYEQPQQEGQQEVIYEQPQGQQQDVIYEQPQEVYENGMQPQNAQIDYSQVAQTMGEPQTVVEQPPQLDYTGITESSSAPAASTPKAKSRAIIVVGDTSYVVESDTPIVQNGTIDQNVLSALMNSNRQGKQTKQQQQQPRPLYTPQSHLKASTSSSATSSGGSGRSLLRTNLLPPKQQTVVGDLGSLQGLLTPPPSSS